MTAETLPPPDRPETELPPLFTLPADMTVESADAVAAIFRNMAGSGLKNLTLDASQVERITTPGIQLIVSLHKSLAAQGGSLVLCGGRDCFAGAFADAGLAALLK